MIQNKAERQTLALGVVEGVVADGERGQFREVGDAQRVDVAQTVVTNLDGLELRTVCVGRREQTY